MSSCSRYTTFDTASIVVSNPGTGTSTGVVVVGTLPDGVQHPAGKEVEFDVGRLEPGERRTIDLTLATTSPGVHAMTVAARADGRLSAESSIPLEVTAPMLELAADMPGRRYLQRPATPLAVRQRAVGRLAVRQGPAGSDERARGGEGR